MGAEARVDKRGAPWRALARSRTSPTQRYRDTYVAGVGGFLSVTCTTARCQRCESVFSVAGVWQAQEKRGLSRCLSHTLVFRHSMHVRSACGAHLLVFACVRKRGSLHARVRLCTCVWVCFKAGEGGGRSGELHGAAQRMRAGNTAARSLDFSPTYVCNHAQRERDVGRHTYTQTRWAKTEEKNVKQPPPQSGIKLETVKTRQQTHAHTTRRKGPAPLKQVEAY